MTQKHIQVLTIDSILDEDQQTFSEISMPLSFDLNDIENEKGQQQHVVRDYDNLFQQEDDSASVSFTKKSSTTKTISKIDQVKSIQVMTKDESVRNFVLKQTPIDDKVFTKNVTFMNISNVSKPFEASNKFIGLPTSIYATSSKFLAVGTSQSSVVLFEMGVKNYRLMQTVNKNRYGATNSVTISKDNSFMICGYQNGYLTIWDLSNFSLTKTIQSQNNDQSILKLQFIKNNQFISSDIQGNVMIHTIEKYVWTSVKSKRLINKSPSIVYYDIRPLKLINGRISTALISYSNVLLITIDPTQILYRFERPSQIPATCIPICDIGFFKNGQIQQSYILISWGTKLFIYLFNPLLRSQPFQLKYVYDHNYNLLSIQIMSPTSFILLDATGSYRIVNLFAFITNQQSFIKSQGILKNDVVAGKCTIQDGKHKNTANTICKSIQSFNEIFFITQGGMFRCRFHKWTQMIYYLIQNKEYLQALKCAIQIFKGKIDIFSQKVVMSPKTMLLYNDMITYYLSMRLKQINSLTDEQIKEVIQTSIEFCLQIQSYDHLFTKVFNFVDKTYRLQRVFLQSLEMFIRQRLIKRIPNTNLLEKIINYYAEEDTSLVDTLILSLDPHSIDYFSTLDVCVNHKLYRSLIYISEVNNDFVSPANKIIQNCVKIRDVGGKTQVIEQDTGLLYLQMIKLLQGKTLVDTILPQKSMKLGLSTLPIWFLVQQNSRQLVNFNGIMYFQMIQKILSDETVAEIINQQQPNQLISKLFTSLRSIAAGYQEYQQGLSNVLIKINERWLLSQQMIQFSLKFLKLPNPLIYKFIDKNYQTISLLLDSTKLTLPKQLKALILLNTKKYEDALSLYEQLPQQELNHLFSHLSNELIMKHTQKLINLDPDATALNIHQNKYSIQQIEGLFSKTSPNGNLYLFIRRLKRLDIFGELIWKKEIQLFYLESLCKFKTEGRVLYQIQRYQDYCILWRQDTLNIVKRHKLKQCEAYLQTESSSSISIYKEVYVIRFANELQKLVYFKYSNAYDYSRVIKSIFKVLQNDQQILQFFGFVLKQFTLPSKKKNYSNIGQQIQDISQKKMMKDNAFIGQIKSLVQTFMIKCAGIDKTELSSLIQSHREVLSMKFIMLPVIGIVSKLSLDIEMFSTITMIVKNDDIDMFDKLLEQKAATFFCKPICRACSLFLTDGISSSHLFACGHCYHTQCLLDPESCPRCSANLFLSKTQKRQTVLLQDSRWKNKSTVPVVINPMYSYISFDKMIDQVKQQDWSIPVIRNDL